MSEEKIDIQAAKRSWKNGIYFTEKEKKEMPNCFNETTQSLVVRTTDEKHIEEFRKEIGLREIKKGVRKCLSCDLEFMSPDLRNIKTCVKCKKNPIEVLRRN